MFFKRVLGGICMLNIMLVDDEVLALKYLKSMVDWEAFGYHIAKTFYFVYFLFFRHILTVNNLLRQFPRILFIGQALTGFQ